MKYKINNKFKTIKKFYNFKLINKQFICIGFIPNKKKYFLYSHYTKHNVKKSAKRNVLKRLFKEYIRLFQYNLNNVNIIFFIKEYIMKQIIYFKIYKLLIKIINF